MAGGEQENRRGESVLFMRVIRLDTGVDLPIVVRSIRQQERMRDGEAGHLLIMNTNQNSERKIFARDKVIIMEVLVPELMHQMVMKAVEQSRVLNSYCMITDHHVYRSYLDLLFFQAICYSCYQVTSHK